MGSIPLPALDLKTPQQPDLLEKYSQLQQLRGNQQLQQIRAQQAPLQMQQLQQGVQSGGLQIQQQQQALKDQQAVTAAMQQWDGKDLNDLSPLVLKNGGSGQAVIGLKQKQLEIQSKAAETFKNMQDGGKAQVDALKTRNDQLAGAFTPLTDPTKVPDAQLPQVLQSTVQSLTSQGTLTPQDAQAAAQLAQQGDPNAIRSGLKEFINSHQALSQTIENAQKDAQTQKALAQASETRGKIDPTSPFYAPSEASVAMGTAPGAAQIQKGKVTQAAAIAGADERARLPGEMSLAAQRQALSQGDPNAAGQLLVNGDATLSELKARGATPEFIAKTLFAARKLSNGTYNAQQSEAQFDVAKSPANVAFFGSAKSLTDPGGTLDQLAETAKSIPQGQIPVFNSIEDAAKAATGSGPIAKYAATLVGVADDYAKVMGGGTGSDASRAQGFKLAAASASPAQREGAIQGIRGAVGSQINSRIGNNPVLKRMYGSAPPSGSPSAPSGGISVGSVITQNGHQYKVTAVDPKTGKPTAADPVQ